MHSCTRAFLISGLLFFFCEFGNLIIVHEFYAFEKDSSLNRYWHLWYWYLKINTGSITIIIIQSVQEQVLMPIASSVTDVLHNLVLVP